VGTGDLLVCLAVFLPTLGAFALPLVGGASREARNGLACGLVFVSLCCALGLIPAVMAGRTPGIHLAGPLGFDLALRADALAVFVAIVSSFISTIILIYSTDYISHYEHQDEYYLMVVLFLGAMMGLVFAANLIVLYVFWEITAIASWRLIGFFRDPQHVIRADKAFLVTVFGSVAMLLGFVTIYAQTGSFNLDAIRTALRASPAPNLAVALILVGILSKSATLPFHTWLPDAGVAPSPVTALLHAAVLVKIGVYVYARLFVGTIPIAVFWHTVVPGVAAASALVSAGAALLETDLKRLIAYSTISQIAFIFLGFASGTEIGVAGGLLYILMHGIAKGGLFLCAGIVEQNAKTKDIRQMGGLMRTMPVTAVAFLFCAFSVMGIPPFGGFFSKYMVMSASAQGQPLWITLTFLVGAFLTIIYLFRVFYAVFLGEPQRKPVREGSPVMVACVAVLAVVALASGIVIQPAAQLAQTATQQMAEVMR
jgi:proton-translocating NADH-quinone oxidoreductase chain N